MLGVLVASLSTVRNAGGDLRLAGTRDRIRSLFVVTQLAEIFHTADTVNRAVASFEKQFSPVPFDIFSTMEEARAWAKTLL